MSEPSPSVHKKASKVALGLAAGGLVCVVAAGVIWPRTFLPFSPVKRVPPGVPNLAVSHQPVYPAIDNLKVDDVLTIVSGPLNATVELGPATYTLRMSKPAVVRMSVFDANTNLITTILQTNLEAGEFTIGWDYTDKAGRKVPMPDDNNGVSYSTEFSDEPLTPSAP